MALFKNRDIKVKVGEAARSFTIEQRNKIEEKIEDKIEQVRDFIPKSLGIFLLDNEESMPKFHPVGECERVISRKTDDGYFSGSRIVLTRDNYGHRATGLGGQGANMCEAIDIVAGSLTSTKTIKDGVTKSRASFAEDGARLYLTERGDVSDYFRAINEDEVVSESSKMKSGAVLKADHTLIIGRERTRILVGIGHWENGERMATGETPKFPRIEIGGIQSKKYHPALLGSSVLEYIRAVNEDLDKLTKKVIELEINLLAYKTAMAQHTHAVGGTIALPDFLMSLPQALDSVPDTFENINESIVDTYNRKLKEFRAFGLTSAGIIGAKSKNFVSSTVFIGE
jgi:hypothetical protein